MISIVYIMFCLNNPNNLPEAVKPAAAIATGAATIAKPLPTMAPQTTLPGIQKSIKILDTLLFPFSVWSY